MMHSSGNHSGGSVLPMTESPSTSPAAIRRRKRLSICVGISLSALCFHSWMQLVASPSSSVLQSLVSDFPSFTSNAVPRLPKNKQETESFSSSQDSFDDNGDDGDDGSTDSSSKHSNDRADAEQKGTADDSRSTPLSVDDEVPSNKVEANVTAGSKKVISDEGVGGSPDSETDSDSNTVTVATGTNATSNSTDAAAPCKPFDPLQWEFQKYSQNESLIALDPKFRKKARKRLLIGMYSGFDSYAKLLDVTASVNKAYAQRWGQDTLVLQGVAMHLGEVDGGFECTPKAGVRPAFNKIKILEYALNHTGEYDQLLLVDTDAMIFDLEFDITTLVDDDSVMLVAHRVHDDAPARGNWDINNGVTLWNLKHPETAGVVADWDRYTRKALTKSNGVGGDQHQLHRAIKYGFGYEHVDERIAAVKATYGEFFYGHGTVVRHFIRNNNGVKELGWKAPNPLDRRIYRLNKARRMICGANPPEVCDTVPYVRYGEGDYDIFSMGAPPPKVPVE